MLKRIITITVVVAAIILFALMQVAPVGVASLKEHNGGKGLLDATFGYTAEEAYEVINATDGEGYNLSLNIHKLDYAFMAMFFLSELLLLSIPLSRIRGKGKLILASGYLFPFGELIADVFENVNLDKVFIGYPQVMTAEVATASLCTKLKWIFTILWLVAFVGAIIAERTALRRYKKSKEGNASDRA